MQHLFKISHYLHFAAISQKKYCNFYHNSQAKITMLLLRNIRNVSISWHLRFMFHTLYNLSYNKNEYKINKFYLPKIIQIQHIMTRFYPKILFAFFWYFFLLWKTITAAKNHKSTKRKFRWWILNAQNLNFKLKNTWNLTEKSFNQNKKLVTNWSF